MPTFISGTLGAGKTLYAVEKMREAIWDGRKVATNIDVDLAHLVGVNNKTAEVYRIPDHPSIDDLLALPYGGKVEGKYSDDEAGVLVLDECGTFLNSRSSMDRDTKDARLNLIDWFIHARKYGWWIYFIAQDYEQVDKQIRIALMEYLVVCKRLDRLRLPFVGWLLERLHITAMLPQIHMATMHYAPASPGAPERGIVVRSENYRARDLYGAYDTTQVFDRFWKFELDSQGTPKMGHELSEHFGYYQLLPPWYSAGRYLRGGIDPLVERLKWVGLRQARLVSLIVAFAVGVAVPAVALSMGDDLASMVDEVWESRAQTIDKIAGEPGGNDSSEDPFEAAESLPGVRKKFEGWWVSGKANYGGWRTDYFLTDGEQVVTQDEVMEYGYEVRIQNDCKVGISDGSAAVWLRCRRDYAGDFVDGGVAL